MNDRDELDNPNVVKVVVDKSFRALYFSRAPIPFVRSVGSEGVSGNLKFYTHLGLYAFQREVLEQVVNLAPSVLEQAESLEQLRWLENGITIQTALTQFPSLGVDTPADLEKIRKQGPF
jgi:3-deoxy-manno-octulosonate cytidylyltransferase (CMP-KDO synthetase)